MTDVAGRPAVRRDGVTDSPTLDRGPVTVAISLRSVLLTLGVLAGCWILIQLAPVLLVIVAALMLVGLLNPVVASLQRRGWRRGRAIALVFIVLAGAVVLLITLTIPELVSQAASFIEREPQLRSEVANTLQKYRATASLAGELRRINYSALLGTTPQQALSSTLLVVESVAYGIGSVFLALYVMLDSDRLRGYVYALVPRREHVRFARIVLKLEGIVGGYIRGQLITCLAMGVFVFLLLTAFGVRSALALAVLAGVADVLPYIGGVLALVPAVLSALPMGVAVAGTVGVAIIIYQEFESRLLVPLVYGKSLRLPSSVVFVALLTGGTLAGITGALLALPFASALLMLIGELRVELPGQPLSAEQDEQQRADDVTEREYDEKTSGMPARDAAEVAVAIAGESQLPDSKA